MKTRRVSSTIQVDIDSVNNPILIQFCLDEEAWITHGFSKLGFTESPSQNSVGHFAINPFRDVAILFHILYKYKDSDSELESFHSFHLWIILFAL